MDSALIEIAGNRDHFTVGDTITGVARVILGQDLSPVENVQLSFHCIGEVKWVEHASNGLTQDGSVYNEEVKYHQEVQPVTSQGIQVEYGTDNQKIVIPFSFTIPKDKDLPSSMITKQGFIKYFIRVTIHDNETEKFKYFTKEVHVQAPMDKNLKISVGGSAERIVFLHHGTAAMHASIDQKGYAPGQTITVHIAVDNSTNIPVVPQIALQQVQIYMSGTRHKTIENTITEEPTTGEPIAPHTEKEMAQLDVHIPKDLVLSIKSSVITVKYFVHVTLKIPHSLDLRVNLPVVITSEQVLPQTAHKPA